ncbi:hypothetical protein BUH_3913 [Burkholderia pseudomallei Pakistan 9]|nr:hypothetical protein BUH_3913 [Burkholderia pseudomallei Pakistan 9]
MAQADQLTRSPKAVLAVPRISGGRLPAALLAYPEPPGVRLRRIDCRAPSA